LRIKYPLIGAIFVTISYDYMMHFYTNVPQGHWFQTSHANLLFINFSSLS